jgi:hypothetical protein
MARSYRMAKVTGVSFAHQDADHFVLLAARS